MKHTRDTAMRKGDWITNHPKSIKGYWPRRAVKIRETAVRMPAGQLFDHVGVCLDEDLVAPVKFYPICRDQKEYAETLLRLKDNPDELKVIEGAYLLSMATAARVQDWGYQRQLEQLFTEDGELDLFDRIDDLAVMAPVGDDYDEPEYYLEVARELWEESH